MSHFLVGVVAKSEISAENALMKFSSDRKVEPYVLYTYKEAINKGKGALKLLEKNPHIAQLVLKKEVKDMNDEDFFNLYIELNKVLYGKETTLDEKKNVISTRNPIGYISSFIDSFDWFNNKYNDNVSVIRFLKDYENGLKGDYYEDKIKFAPYYIFADKENVFWDKDKDNWDKKKIWSEHLNAWTVDRKVDEKDKWLSRFDLEKDYEDYDELEEEFEKRVVLRLKRLEKQGYYIFFYECT